MKLLDQSSNTSLPVIVLKGKKKKLVGMVSAWDVMENLLVNMCDAGPAAGTGETEAPEPDKSKQT